MWEETKEHCVFLVRSRNTQFPPGANPFDPFAEAPYEFHTVRQYFQDLKEGAKSWLKGFEKLRREAHRSFDALSEKEQGEIMLKSLGGIYRRNSCSGTEKRGSREGVQEIAQQARKP
jgi:hypothetical protein